jgi:glutamine synthetase
MSSEAPGGALVEEAEAFLGRHPEIVAFDIVLTDANGIGRGKIIRRHELLPLYRDGRHLPGSILGLDVAGEDVEETGLVWSDGDADRRAWPIPGTLVPLPFTSPPRGQVLLGLYELDGAPMPADPRHALARQDALLRGIGLAPVAAYELEFYLFDRERPPGGRPAPARLPVTGERPAAIQAYRVEELDRLEPFVDAVYRAADAQALPLETMISEYAAGQYELTLRHRGEALRAADDIVLLKRLLRGIAARHGMVASFMAKPLPDAAGSGMHLHASLAGPAGDNLFADEDGALAPLLTEAVAGLLATMQEAMLVFAPHLNSWRRFAAASYAPVAPTWGANNRSVAVRLPAGRPESRHLEQRVAGVDANPYLVGATVLAGIRHGIAGRLEPPPAVTGDGYAAAPADGLPMDWRAAIETAARSAFLRDALGERMHTVFLALKRAEWRRLAADVTEQEYGLYLEAV